MKRVVLSATLLTVIILFSNPALAVSSFGDFSYYAEFALDWETCVAFDPCSLKPGDIVPDGCVNIYDLEYLCDSWLGCVIWRASNPRPADNEINVSGPMILQWTRCEYCTSYDVYFGTDSDEVDNADVTDMNVFMGNQDVNYWDTNNFDVNGLDSDTTYYWRIDQNAFDCMSKGKVWNFKTKFISEFKLTASDGAGGDSFGRAVAISGNRCVVGSFDDDDKGADSGSAYIYEWNGTNWTQQAKLTASDGAAGDYFGYAVSISGNRCIVGAYGDDDRGSNSGSAYIYDWNGTNWMQQPKLTASDGTGSDYFGYVVSISGDRCIVGAYGDDDMGSSSGSAYIYKWNGTSWAQQAKLTASDGAGGDSFGRAVAISGDRCVAGASGDDDMGSNSGSAYIFLWNGTNWIQQTKLTATDGASGDSFGWALSISGDRCIIGASGDDDMGTDSGSAYIYEWNGANWTQQAKLTASDGTAGDSFGYVVSISGDRCVAGAYGDDDMGLNSGSAYIYKRNGTNWAQQAKLTASDGAGSDSFGSAVSISSDRCIVGAYLDDDMGTDSGSAYIYELGP